MVDTWEDVYSATILKRADCRGFGVIQIGDRCFIPVYAVTRWNAFTTNRDVITFLNEAQAWDFIRQRMKEQQ